MPVIAVAERDYTAVFEKMTSIGPLLEKCRDARPRASRTTSSARSTYLRARNGVVHGGAGDGQPKVETDVQMADAMLHLAGVSNGHLATQGFRFLEKRTGTELADLAAEHEGKQITFADTQVAPGAGDHLAGVVRVGVGRAALQPRSPSTSSGRSRSTP